MPSGSKNSPVHDLHTYAVLNSYMKETAAIDPDAES